MEKDKNLKTLIKIEIHSEFFNSDGGVLITEVPFDSWILNKDELALMFLSVVDKVSDQLEKSGYFDHSKNNISKKEEVFETLKKEMNNVILKNVAKWLIGDYMRLLNVGKDKKNVSPRNFFNLTEMVRTEEITEQSGKEVLEIMFDTGKSPEDIVKEKKLKKIHNKDFIERIAGKVVETNSKIVNDIKRNPNAIEFLIGRVMKKAKGRADAKIVRQVLKDFL